MTLYISKIKVQIYLILLILLTLFSIYNNNVMALEGESIDVSLQVNKYAQINIVDREQFMINIDYGVEDEVIEDSIEIEVKANTEITVKIEIASSGFENQTDIYADLNEWIEYNIDLIDGPKGSISPGESWEWVISNEFNSPVSKKIIKLTTIFDREAAYNSNWYELEAGNYEDEIVYITVKAN